MTEVYRRGFRRFLNRPGFHADASASVQVQVDLPPEEGSDPWAHGTFQVRDCLANVTLSLDVHSGPYYRNTVAKLRKLRDACDAALEITEEARWSFVEAKDKAARKRKAKGEGGAR